MIGVADVRLVLLRLPKIHRSVQESDLAAHDALHMRRWLGIIDRDADLNLRPLQRVVAPPSNRRMFGATDVRFLRLQLWGGQRAAVSVPRVGRGNHVGRSGRVGRGNLRSFRRRRRRRGRHQRPTKGMRCSNASSHKCYGQPCFVFCVSVVVLQLVCVVAVVVLVCVFKNVQRGSRDAVGLQGNRAGGPTPLLLIMFYTALTSTCVA